MSRVGVGAGGRKLWRCDTCGLVSAWTESWQWFGSLLDEDERRHETLPTFCSQKCADAAGHKPQPQSMAQNRAAIRRAHEEYDREAGR